MKFVRSLLGQGGSGYGDVHWYGSGSGLVLQKNIGVVVGKSVDVCGSGVPAQTAISEQEIRY